MEYLNNQIEVESQQLDKQMTSNELKIAKTQSKYAKVQEKKEVL